MSDSAMDPTQPESLEEIRARIDRLDEQIQQLISERATLAREVGTRKQDAPLKARDFYRPEREAQVLRNVLARNPGPLRDEEMVRLFREIMSACLAQQEPLKVAFLGPEGTFSHQAVVRQFGALAEHSHACLMLKRCIGLGQINLICVFRWNW